MKAFLIAVALTAGAAASALAATEAPAPTSSSGACFSSSQWNSWKAKDDKTMYLRVGIKDVYEVGFRQGCREARSPGARLVTVFRGSNYVCRPIDLDIKVVDGGASSFQSSCIATSLRKLSADEAKAIPKKDQP